MAASASTERNTWRRLAPTIRSRASSRVRCPTMIENVLKMVNAPTNSEMNAKTSSAVEKKRQRLVDRARLLVHHGLPGDHLHARRQVPGDGLLDRGLVGARVGHHVDVVELADLLDDVLRGREVNAARVAPARLLAVPNWAMPVMVKVRGGPATGCGPAARR